MDELSMRILAFVWASSYGGSKISFIELSKHLEYMGAFIHVLAYMQHQMEGFPIAIENPYVKQRLNG